MKKDELLKNIEKYWTNRAEGYSQVNLEELAGKNGRSGCRSLKNICQKWKEKG